MTVHVDPEFQALIPPLSPDEQSQLEENLRREGCREALVVWRGILVDGHHRYEICQQHDLPFTTFELPLESRDEVILWMINNQLGRRNIPAYVRVELALRAKPILEKQAKAKQGTRNDLCPNSDKGEPMRANTEVGKKAKVGKTTVHQVETVKKDAPEVIQQKARAGEITINRAYLITQVLGQRPSKELLHIIDEYEVDDPEVIKELKRLEKDKADTFEEVYRSGYIQPGEDTEAVHIASGYKAVSEALKLKARIHHQLSYEAKERARDELANHDSEVMVKLYHGVAENLYFIPDNSVDLIITSPPYNLGDDHWPMGGNGRTPRQGIGYSDSRGESEYQAWQIECLIELYRVAAEGASLFYNHKVRIQDGQIIHPIDWLHHKRNPWWIRQEIIWDRKSTHNHSKTLFWPQDERIYWLTKGKPVIGDMGIHQPSIWTMFGPEPERSWHPAPFPESLPEMLIKAIGRKEITILDPFCGSGTTLRVARKYGATVIGVDSNLEYIKRLEKESGWMIASSVS